jgi:hypothetical protein
MNDEQMQALLEVWFDDTDPTPPDSRQTAAQVMARVPDTRQRGRWRPFPSLRRGTQTTAVTDTVEYPSSRIPAGNGHAPTVNGRTQIMFSPAMAVTAGALIFALGGLFLVTQPFAEHEAAVSAMQRTALRGEQVTVTQACDFEVDPPACTWTSNDPRLTGTLTIGSWNDIYVTGPQQPDSFTWMANSFEGPDGTWSGHVYVMWGEPTQSFLTLSGSGAHEGWHFVASNLDPDSDGYFDWTGVMYEGEPPALGLLQPPTGD